MTLDLSMFNLHRLACCVGLLLEVVGIGKNWSETGVKKFSYDCVKPITLRFFP
jgi:hypothetical protein